MVTINGHIKRNTQMPIYSNIALVITEGDNSIIKVLMRTTIATG